MAHQQEEKKQPEIKPCNDKNYVNGDTCYKCHWINNDPNTCQYFGNNNCNLFAVGGKGEGACPDTAYQFLCKCGPKDGYKVYHATDSDGARGIVESQMFKDSNGGIFGNGIYLALSANEAKAKADAYHKEKTKKGKNIDSVVECTINGVPNIIPVFTNTMELKGKQHWTTVLANEKADFFYIKDAKQAYNTAKYGQAAGAAEIVAFNTKYISKCKIYKSNSPFSDEHFVEPDNFKYNYGSVDINMERALIALNLLMLILFCLLCACLLGCASGFGINHLLFRVKDVFKFKRTRPKVSIDGIEHV